MIKVVVSGATGFLGSNLIKQLILEGYYVYALARKDSKGLKDLIKNPNLKIIYSSFDEIDLIPKSIPEAEVFIHTAWGGVNRDELDSFEIQKKNIEVSMRYLRVMKSIGVKYFMDFGSRAEYGNVDAYEESTKCEPNNNYGKAKFDFFQKAKEYCKINDILYLHLRIFSVYGYGDHPWSLVSTLSRELPLGHSVSLGPCNQLWNFIYIKDAVKAMTALLKNMMLGKINTGEIVNLASGRNDYLKSFIQEANSIFGNKSVLEFGKFSELSDSKHDLNPSTDKLMKLTKGDYEEKYSFSNGLFDMVSLMKNKKRIAVMGNGFVGKNIASHYLNNGDHVDVLDYLDFSFLNENDVKNYFENTEKYDAVFYCAYIGGTRNTGYDNGSDYSIIVKNIQMFDNIGRCLPKDTKYIHFGSGAQYSKNRDLLKIKEDETGEIIPSDEYGYAKYLINEIIKSRDNYYNLIVFGLYGINEDPFIRFITNSCYKNILNLPFIINQNVIFDYLFIEDLFKITDELVYKNEVKYRVFNVTPDKSISLESICKLINEVGNNKCEINFINDGLNYEYTGNNERLHINCPNIEFTSYKEGIKSVYDFCLKNVQNIDTQKIINDAAIKNCKTRK